MSLVTSSETNVPQAPAGEISPNELAFSRANLTSYGVPHSAKSNAVSDAMAKIMGQNSVASMAVGFGGVVAAATALLGSGVDATSAFTAAGAGVVASVAGGFRKPNQIG